MAIARQWPRRIVGWGAPVWSERPFRLVLEHFVQPLDPAVMGSLANGLSAGGDKRAYRSELGTDTEDCVDELTLSDRIALGYPADLPFADCVHRLVTLDRSLLRAEAEFS
jgi:hypothetical protein